CHKAIGVEDDLAGFQKRDYCVWKTLQRWRVFLYASQEVQSNCAGKFAVDICPKHKGVFGLVEIIDETLVPIPLNSAFIQVRQVPQVVDRIEIGSGMDALVGHAGEQ